MSGDNALKNLLAEVLKGGDKTALETYLVDNSHLPDASLNLALVGNFAALIGEIVTQPNPPVEQLEELLDGWAVLTLESVSENSSCEILPGV
jgi:hypothetical protein